MATESVLEFNEEGGPVEKDVRTLEVPHALAEKDSSEGVDQILRLIEDPEAPLGDITRLIAIEIAKIMKVMRAPKVPLEATTSQKDLVEQVKAWQVLQKTLSESDALSKKDAFNMDGPKFAYFFREIMRLFAQSLKDAGVDPSLQQNIMLQFADSVKANDQNIRRELSKIESGR